MARGQVLSMNFIFLQEKGGNQECKNIPSKVRTRKFLEVKKSSKLSKFSEGDKVPSKLRKFPEEKKVH